MRILGELSMKLRNPYNVSEEFNGTAIINKDLLDKLTKPSPDSTYTIEAITPVQVQARTHKKKRINKKWLKRYGYKQIFKPIKFKNVSFKDIMTPNEMRAYLGFEMEGGLNV